ncbi:efflux RND transporter periplasmic adaptor subunit [Leucobacter viscericola]|uniref:Efflux RND transporter periplasmic adaptor subunit n=1 Tax=Leucobacter viscericola TaxID=2714935 RepID=A0A6G7XBK1_9MICO|nr:efflux RND transporter periplasmic adaptor subunit [Leucobacter viscericola]QIK61974.1 efflux RND transporter periplasmic adaptor subunit [Leucobacter viscericola]
MSGIVVSADAPQKRARRRWLLVISGTAIVLALAGGMSWVTLSSVPVEGRSEKMPQRNTVKVIRGDLVEQTLISGTLSYIGEQKIEGPAGILTSHPAPGAIVHQGETLFAVDNVPVILLIGELPQWRSFAIEMEPGPDVIQLETALRDLGFFWSEPDEYFDADTRYGIRLWQEANDREVTGEIGLGEVVFSPGPLRIASVLLPSGSATGPGVSVISATSIQKAVSVEVKLAQQQLAVLDSKVEVELPGGKRTGGTVTAVDPPREQETNNPSDGEAPTIIPVSITLDQPDEAEGFDKATVRVFFTSETKPDVLSVPVSALLALRGGGTGVEIVRSNGTTKQVPVETGLFAGGMVEVSGDEIAEGTTVVVPEA